MKKALLIVDIENDFLPGGALGVPGGDEIVSGINKLMKLPFDVIIATKDFHPPNHCSFASRWGKKVGERIEVNGIEQILWPDHCIQGTKGAEFAPSLDISKFTHILHKGQNPEIDSYSAFFDNKKMGSTGLDQLLREKSIEKLYIAGIATNFCVLYSVFDAVALGFKVCVIKDACRGIEVVPGAVDRAFSEMQRLGVEMTTTDALLSGKEAL